MSQAGHGPDDPSAVPPKGAAGSSPHRRTPPPVPPEKQPRPASPDVYRAEFEAQSQQLLDSQESLAAALTRYRSLYDNAPMGYISLDCHGCMRELNQTAAQWLGIDREQLIGKPLASYIVPDDRDAVRSHVTQCTQTHGMVVTEVRLDRKLRHPLPVVLESVCPHGEYLYLTMITDLTDRYKAQEKLGESESRFRQIAENIHEVFWLGMPDWSEILYISPAFEQIWGWPCEVLYEKPLSWIESVVPEDREAVLAAARAWDSDQPAAVIVTPDFRITRPDGTRRWISTRTFPIVDNKGRLWRIAGVSEDITDRKLAQLRLELSVRVLEILNRPAPLREALQQVLVAIREHTGLEGAGIRLRVGDDFQYAQTDGLPEAFVAQESCLLQRDAAGRVLTDDQGRPFLECVCGEVLRSQADGRAPCFSAGGSFYTNSTTDLLQAPPERLRKIRTRNRCHEAGYESVALIPLRAEGVILGLLHLVDHRRNQFPPERLQFLEGLGASLGAALHRAQLAKTVRESEERYRSLFNSMTEGFALHEILTDEAGRPVDYRFLDINPAFERLTGLNRADTVGRTAKAMLPGLEPHWIEQYGRVALGGESAHFDDHSADLGKYYSVFAYQTAPRQFATIFMDITERRKAEESLQARQAELLAVHDNISVMTCLLDAECHILFANRALIQFTGPANGARENRRPGNVLGCIESTRDPRGCGFGPDCTECALRAAIHDTLATGKPHQNVERRMTVERGDHRQDVILLCSTTLVHSAGKDRILLCLEDITERTHAADALKKSERINRALIEATDDVTMLMAPDGTILTGNSALAKVFHRDLSEIVGRKVEEILPPALAESRMRQIRKALESGQPVEFIDRRDDRWIDSRLHPILDDHGQVVQLAIYGRDITEHRKADEALQKSEQQYRTLFENMLEGCAYCKMIYDDQGRPVDWIYLAVNKAFEPASGLKNVVGKRVTEIIPGIRESNPDLFQAYGRVASTGQPTEFEAHVPALALWAHISAFCPAPDHFVAIFENINERHRAEERLAAYQQRLRTLGSRLAKAEEDERRRIAAELHDNVAQTLAVARVRLQTIGTESLPPEVVPPFNEVLELIQKAVHDTRYLLFDLSPPPLYDLGLEAGLEWLAEKMQKEHPLKVQVESDPEPLTLGQEVRGILFRAVRELLMNVVKHAHAQTATVSVHRQGEKVRIEVRDNGQGFSAEKVQASKNFLGGFGLFEVRERLDYVGGSLEILSPPEGGTCAILVAPLDSRPKK
jgi:PAS domain S-box-containing protein